MKQVILDTSFLITLANQRKDRPNHATAVEYFRHCVTNQIPMWISSIAAGEFQVGQPVTDLPLQNFQTLSYSWMHALRAADFYKETSRDKVSKEGSRAIIINDLKIIAQAAEEKIPLILTEDENTLSKMVARLRKAGLTEVDVILLSDGFSPDRFIDPAQKTLGLASDGNPM